MVTIKTNTMKNINQTLFIISAFLIMGLNACQNNGVNTSEPYCTPGSHPVVANSDTAKTSTESGEVIGYIHKEIYRCFSISR